MKKSVLLFILLLPGLICRTSGSISCSVISGDTALLQANIRNCIEVNHIPGLVAAIVHGETVLWKNAFGVRDRERQLPMTNNTIFWLASLSKTITSTVIMQLKEQGDVDLDENVNSYLSYQVQNPFHPTPPVTVRHLLTHTAALADDWSLLSEMTTIGYDSPIPLNEFLENYYDPSGTYYDPVHFYQYPPGSAYNYCNTGMGMTGNIVEAIMGIDFRTWCDVSIFSPLGMNSASWTLAATDTSQKAFGYGYANGQFIRYNHTGRPDYPAGWLNATIGDLSPFLQTMIGYGKHGGVRILDSATVAEMLTVQFPSLTSWNGRRWGLGIYECQMAGRTLWGHWGHGWGHTHNMYFDRNSGIGVIVLSNGDSEAGVDSIMLNLFEFAEAIITPFATPVGGKPVYFNIFPNPCRDEVRFLIAENYHSGNLLTIQSLQGQEVLTISTNGSSVTWDLRNKNGLHIRPGIYIVSLKTENGRPISAKKLIVIS